MTIRDMMHDVNREHKTEEGLGKLLHAVLFADRLMHYEIEAHSGELEYCRNRLTEILNKVDLDNIRLPVRGRSAISDHNKLRARKPCSVKR